MASTDRVRSGALIGRVQELAALEHALDRLAGGESWALGIAGEAGIGKSRLLSELGARAEARGCLVLDGRAAEFEREVPFGVLLDALNDYLGALDPALLSALGEEVVGELAEIFPALAAFTGGSSVRRLEAERYRAHYAIRALLERLTGRQPLVLALDDMHWSDAGTIEAVAHLLRRFRGPLLTVCAFRQAPVRLAATLELTQRAGRCAQLVLGPLSPREADALLGESLDPNTRAELSRESGGNPFYLQELGRAAAQRAPPTARVEPMHVVGHELEVPGGVAAAIRNELAELSAAPRRVLEAAAVAGEAFEPELVGAIAELSEPAVLAGLDALLAADFVRPTDAPRRFRFRHPIVRRAVYEWTTGGWRLGAHARAAAALELAGGSLAARANHVERSATPGDDAAIALLIDAARSVAARAPVSAGRRLKAALGLLTEAAAPELRLTLLTEAADALAQAGAFQEALPLLTHALELVPEERGPERAGLTARVAAVKRQTGHPHGSRELLEQALRSLPTAAGAAGLTLRLELAIDCYFRGDFAGMREAAVAVADDARAQGDRLTVTVAAALAGLAAASVNEIEVGLVHLRDALVAFETVPDERLTDRIDTCGWLAMAAFALERFQDALPPVQRGLTLPRATGQGSVIPGLLNLQVQLLILAGAVTEAVSVAETAVEAALLSGNGQLIVWASEAAAMAAMWAGDTDGALANAREAVAHSERLGQSFFAPLARLRLAGALFAAGDAAACRAQLAALDSSPARQLLDLAGAHGWELLTRTHLALGDLDAAEATAARAHARAASTGLPQQCATAACARAAVLLARGAHRGAEGTARAATADAEHAGNPLLAARARVLTGRALAGQGRREEAITMLELAHAALVGCGANLETDAAAHDLRQLGQRVHRHHTATRRSAQVTLSAREREVADHVVRGETNRQVAAALYLSEKTIESHLTRIYDKLGVHSRAALATMLTATAPPGATEQWRTGS